MLYRKIMAVYSEINITISMMQNPSWVANRFSATQEIPGIFWNPTGHYRIHKDQPPVPVLSQMNEMHAAIPFLAHSF